MCYSDEISLREFLEQKKRFVYVCNKHCGRQCIQWNPRTEVKLLPTCDEVRLISGVLFISNVYVVTYIMSNDNVILKSKTVILSWDGLFRVGHGLRFHCTCISPHPTVTIWCRELCHGTHGPSLCSVTGRVPVSRPSESPVSGKIAQGVQTSSQN